MAWGGHYPTTGSPIPDEVLDALDVAANATRGAAVGYDTSRLQDPHKFIFQDCKTLDPDDPVDPIKPFPDHEYLRVLLDLFLKDRLIVIPKSRQLMVSWLCCAYALWKAMSRKGAVVFIVSKKEADAGFDNDLSLLSRCWFMYQHLPQDLRIPADRGFKPPVISFQGQYSSITGLPQDSDALRQYTATLVLCDEWAFQEKAANSYAAMRPTLNRNGQLIGVSTSNGRRNLFYRIVSGENAK